MWVVRRCHAAGVGPPAEGPGGAARRGATAAADAVGPGGGGGEEGEASPLPQKVILDK